MLFDSRLEAKFRASPNIRAKIEAGADQDERKFELKDAFLEVRRRCGPHRFKAGRDRKVLGWHYEHPAAQRIGIDLDPPNAFLNERSFTIRDYFVSWDWSKVKESCPDPGGEEKRRHPMSVLAGSKRARAGAAFFFSQSNDYSLLAHSLIRVGESWAFGGWIAVDARETKNPHEPLYLWAAAFSVLFEKGVHRAELEGFAGKDPLASELARERGEAQVGFAATSARYALLLGLWNPYLTASFLSQDTSVKMHVISAIAGLRYFFEPHLSVAAELRDEMWRGVGHNPDETRVQLLGRYYF